MKKIIFVLLILLIGCAREECPPEKIIIQNTTIINITNPMQIIEVEKIIELDRPCVNMKEYDSGYVIGLINQIKRCENSLIIYNETYNYTCHDDYNDCRQDLNRSETKLQELKDLIE